MKLEVPTMCRRSDNYWSLQYWGCEMREAKMRRKKRDKVFPFVLDFSENHVIGGN